eukprot:CAMPEP_0173403482 /NCGR_PEP_ID=MMETSP1356-20130122/56935_1 /TAXON_ID=77927 ORGANISM="Hemiselmis virescens, Strain PCC157" /NCGR_SAMPLE_ID=MMETSP1356 /ASSEMBLY_ACC=CAM_ASM_000847 /LENGTH=99 /DNA_ID=CAMNT_0014364021 /DNA_START=59 /DNA_END=355 /DNA_ORIENTATION=-
MMQPQAADQRTGYQNSSSMSSPAAPYLDPRMYQASLSQHLKQLGSGPGGAAGPPKTQDLVYMAPRPFVPVAAGPRSDQRRSPYIASQQMMQQQQQQQQQ